jgi:FAD:protein FMN transferase
MSTSHVLPCLLFGLAPTACAAPSAKEEVRVERRLALMGTGLTLEVEAPDRATALAASEAAVRALEATEARLSTWREDSELARLNRATVGRPFPLSEALARELQVVARLHAETAGAFDPGIGGLVRAWDLRGAGRFPSAAELERCLAVGGLGALELTGRLATRTHPDLQLEEGGFGKGAGLDAALAALRSAGATHGTLDLGGQLAFLGPETQRAVVADPRARARNVVAIEVRGGSVATSGNSERGLLVEGETIGHLLDPRTGRPAPDFGSLTVWAPTALEADALSTGLFVLGPQAALDYAASHQGIEVLVLEAAADGLLARPSAGLAPQLTLLQGDVTLNVVAASSPIDSTPLP